MPDRSCSVASCERPLGAAGYCSSHYAWWRRTGVVPTHELKPRQPPICTADGCDRPTKGLNLCLAHYQRFKKNRPLTAEPIRVAQPLPDECVVDGCVNPPKARGWCVAHYKRHRRNGTVDLPTFEEAFWQQVNKTDSCWEWTGGTRGTMGYGRVGRRYRSLGTHRVSWELTHGPIPAGLDVLHHCDNPPCVRPDHLFLGTDADNAADKMAKGRGNNTHSGRGKKLTWAAVEQIRELVVQGVGYDELADQFNVTDEMVWRIATNRSWDPAKRRSMDS